MKQTEIGLIPDDWEVKSLGTIADLLTGYPFPGNEIKTEGTYRLLRGINITEGDVRHSEGIDRYYSGDISPLKKYLLQENDLVIGMDGSKVGKNSAIISESNSNSLLVQRVARLREIKNLSSIEFISQFINSYFFSNYVDSLKTSSAIPHISPANIINFIVPFPPLAEQQRIAKALSDVDSLIFTTEKLLQKKKNIKQGTMQELLTGKKRLPGFAKSNNTKMTELGEIPEDWEVKNLGELFDMKAGGDVDKEHFSYCKSSIYKYKIFSNGLENEGIYGYTDLPKYKGNAITITGRGTVGIAMFREEDFDAVIRLLVLNSKNDDLTNNSYITEEINSCISFPNESTGVPQLTVPQIRDIVIVLPSKEEQTAIANVLSSMDKEIETLNTKLEKYRNLKTAMMQQLLTGKIRL